MPTRPVLRLSLGFAGGFAIALTLLALAPRSMPNRLSTLHGDAMRLAGLYNRLDNDPRPIDVAFIGSSHTVEGVDDGAIERNLAQRGVAAHVANLGMYVIGRDLQLMLVKELLARKRPKLIVVEVDDHETPTGHPYLPYVARVSDLVACGISSNLPQMFLLFLRQQFRGFLDAVLPGAPPPAPLPRLTYGYQPVDGIWSGADYGVVSQGDRLEKWVGPWARAAMYRAISHFGDSAVRQIVALAHADGAEVMFLYLPEFRYAARPDPAVIGQYAQLGPVTIMPRDVAADRGDWVDHAHLNEVGGQKMVPLLTGAVGAALGTPLYGSQIGNRKTVGGPSDG
jgi:hypothetical protein